jgi:putative NADPH-quinone reductase
VFSVFSVVQGSASGAIQVLVLFCHPTRDSFAGSVLAELAGSLRGAGHAVRVVDL